MSARENNFLKVRPSVVLTPRIDKVITELDLDFEKAGLYAEVSSGLRKPEGQLKIIQDYLSQRGLEDQFPESFGKPVSERIHHDKFGLIYAWQLGWSKLLNIGLIINPPIAAACLMDYYRSGVNKKGAIIKESPHFKGGAFDISGGKNGISDELKVVQSALARKAPGLVGIVIERENNCIHCDCE